MRRGSRSHCRGHGGSRRVHGNEIALDEIADESVVTAHAGPFVGRDDIRAPAAVGAADEVAVSACPRMVTPQYEFPSAYLARRVVAHGSCPEPGCLCRRHKARRCLALPERRPWAPGICRQMGIAPRAADANRSAHRARPGSRWCPCACSCPGPGFRSRLSLDNMRPLPSLGYRARRRPGRPPHFQAHCGGHAHCSPCGGCPSCR